MFLLTSTTAHFFRVPNSNKSLHLKLSLKKSSLQATSNENFTSFAQKVRRVSKTGTSCKLTGNDLGWFLQSPVNKKEYCYAASRLNPATGESSNSATMCVTLDPDLPTISQSQVNTFSISCNCSPS